MKAFTEWEIVSRETIKTLPYEPYAALIVALARHDNGEAATLFLRYEPDLVRVYGMAQDAITGGDERKLGTMSTKEWDGQCECHQLDDPCDATLDVDGYLRNCYQDVALPTLASKGA